jgi:hypothetical protein
MYFHLSARTSFHWTEKERNFYTRARKEAGFRAGEVCRAARDCVLMGKAALLDHTATF